MKKFLWLVPGIFLLFAMGCGGSAKGNTSSSTPTASPSPTPAPNPTPNPSPTPVPSPTPSPTPTPTPTPGPTPSPTPGPNDFFVSPSGSDSNNGSASAPWATIQHAANSVGPGATVLVADGTYNECSITISNSGTSSSPITFQSINKWGAKIVYPVGCTTGVQVSGSFVTVKFLDISGGGTSGGGVSGGSTAIYLQGGSNHIVFNNRIHNIGNIASDTTNAMAGIFVSTQNDVLDSNILFGIGRTGCVSSCPLHNDHPMYIDGAAGAGNILVKNNLFYNNQHGFQIQLFPGSFDGATIVNNTMDATSPPSNGATGCMVQGSTLSNSRISNNICTNPNGGVMIANGCCGDSARNVLIDHNITNVGSMLPVNNGYTIDSTNVFNANASIIYNNFGANDFSLTASSPALGVATGATAPPVDSVGTPRPQNGRFDAGAYEFPH